MPVKSWTTREGVVRHWRDIANGDMFGHWRALGPRRLHPSGKHSIKQALCVCEGGHCDGSEQWVWESSLFAGLSAQCRKCSYAARRKKREGWLAPTVAAGSKFGDFVVLTDSGELSDYNRSKVVCRCLGSHCGGWEGPVPSRGLLSGKLTKCAICESVGRFTEEERRARDELSGFRRRWTNIKAGAKSRGLDVTITPEYIREIFTGKCALSGVEISIEYIGRVSGKRKFDISASLDRIDSSKGYIPGNVQWVHKQVNTCKSDLPDEEFIELCRKIVDVADGKTLDNGGNRRPRAA